MSDSRAMTDRPTCKTCRFWAPSRREDEETPQGKLYADTEAECRIRAPHIADDFRRARWPITSATAWCGEHEPLPPPPKPWACSSAWCSDPKPHWHIVHPDRSSEIAYGEHPPPVLLLPSKPSKKCTCPRSPGIHEHVEGYCL